MTTDVRSTASSVRRRPVGCAAEGAGAAAPGAQAASTPQRRRESEDGARVAGPLHSGQWQQQWRRRQQEQEKQQRSLASGVQGYQLHAAPAMSAPPGLLPQHGQASGAAAASSNAADSCCTSPLLGSCSSLPRALSRDELPLTKLAAATPTRHTRLAGLSAERSRELEAMWHQHVQVLRASGRATPRSSSGGANGRAQQQQRRRRDAAQGGGGRGGRREEEEAAPRQPLTTVPASPQPAQEQSEGELEVAAWDPAPLAAGGEGVHGHGQQRPGVVSVADISRGGVDSLMNSRVEQEQDEPALAEEGSGGAQGPAAPQHLPLDAVEAGAAAASSAAPTSELDGGCGPGSAYATGSWPPLPSEALVGMLDNAAAYGFAGAATGVGRSSGGGGGDASRGVASPSPSAGADGPDTTQRRGRRAAAHSAPQPAALGSGGEADWGASLGGTNTLCLMGTMPELEPSISCSKVGACVVRVGT